MSKLRTQFTADDPVVLDANFPLGSKADRRKIDDQILDLQRAVVATSLVNGSSSNFQLSPSASAPIVAGMGFCLSQDAPAGSYVTAATSGALAAAGSPIGIALQGAPAGTFFAGLLKGPLKPSAFNLGAGAATPIGLDATTGMLKRIPSPGGSDVIVGTCSTDGTCTITSAGGSAGAAGAPGAGVIPAVDILIDSNVASLTGVQTWNGISTSGKRALLIGQTTGSQNGTYTCGTGGAWVSDFSNDTQVAAAIGQPVYCKPGGLTGQDVTFYLQSGATLAASKVYKRGATGKIAPIRSAQVLPLTADLTTIGTPWVYDSVAGTLTAPVNGAAPSPWPLFDGITTPALGDRLENNSMGVADVSNGVFAVSSLGSAGSKIVLTRTSDLNSSLAFAQGAAYEVLDGLTLKGSRRGMLTPAPVTLGTTPLAFGPLRSANPLVIDTTLPRYGIVGNPTNTFAVRTPDYTAALNQAILDAFNAGGGTTYSGQSSGGTVVLPQGHPRIDGIIRMRAGVRLTGAGRDKTFIYGAVSTGGFQMHVGIVYPLPIYGSAISTDFYGITPTPLKMYHTGGDVGGGGGGGSALMKSTGTNHFYDAQLNLTVAGLDFDQWANYESRVITKFDHLAPYADPAVAPATPGGTVTPGSHVYSTRGRLMIGMPIRTNDLYYTQPDGSVHAVVRAWHPSKVKSSGTSPPALTLSGPTTIPTDCLFRCEVTTGGARGTFRFRVSANGGITWLQSNVLSAATNTLTVGRLYGVVLNWANASASTDNVYENFEELALSTAASVVDTTHSYQYMMRFDGTTAKLYVDQLGAAYATPSGSQVATTVLTGAVVNRFVCEESLLGGASNDLICEGSAGTFNAGHFNLDSFSASSVFGADGPGASGGLANVPTHMPVPTGPKSFWFIPSVSYALTDDEGTYAWKCTANGQASFVHSTRTTQRDFQQAIAVDNLSFESINTRRGGILVTSATIHSQFENLSLSNTSQYGLRWIANGYGNSFNELYSIANRGVDFCWNNCETPLRGSIYADGANGVGHVEIGSAGSQAGTIWAGGGNGLAAVVLAVVSGNCKRHLNVDDEGGNGSVYPSVCMSSVGTLEVEGVLGGGNSNYEIYVDSGGATGRVVLNCAVAQVAGGANVITIGDTGVKPIQLGPSYYQSDPTIPYASRPGYVIPYGGHLAPIVLADTNATLTADSYRAVSNYTMAVATARTLRLAGLKEGNEARIVIGSVVTTALQIVDDASSTTIDTIATGLRGTFVYRSNGTIYGLAP